MGSDVKLGLQEI